MNCFDLPRHAPIAAENYLHLGQTCLPFEQSFREPVRLSRFRQRGLGVLLLGAMSLGAAARSGAQTTELASPDLQTSSSAQNIPPVPAQTPSDPSTSPTTQVDQKAEADKELKQAKSQRILGVVPNFNTVINGRAVPLSPKQKFDLAFHSATDPAVFVFSLVDAGLSEAEDSNKGYGHGPSGYFKRFGASYADSFDGAIIGNALFPSLLHQDPRYYRKGSGPVRHRILYAVASTVICKGDNGKWQPNYSNVLGNFAAGGISNLYYPAEDRGLSQTTSSALTVTAEGAIGSLFVEFWPDIQRHFRKH